jgi:hypothetical protein
MGECFDDLLVILGSFCSSPAFVDGQGDFGHSISNIRMFGTMTKLEHQNVIWKMICSFLVSVSIKLAKSMHGFPTTSVTS